MEKLLNVIHNAAREIATLFHFLDSVLYLLALLAALVAAIVIVVKFIWKKLFPPKREMDWGEIRTGDLLPTPHELSHKGERVKKVDNAW